MLPVERAPLMILDQRGQRLFDHVYVPNTFLGRLRGLLGRDPPSLKEAWWFPRCSAVHTFGMRFPIDIIHLSSSGVILRISPRVPAGRLCACIAAASILEAREGAATKIPLEIGQRLEIRQ